MNLYDIAMYGLLLCLFLPLALIFWGDHDYKQAVLKNPNIDPENVCINAGGFYSIAAGQRFCIIGKTSHRMFSTSTNYYDQNFTWVITNEGGST